MNRGRVLDEAIRRVSVVVPPSRVYSGLAGTGQPDQLTFMPRSPLPSIPVRCRPPAGNIIGRPK